jgi:methylenetetrahydrofolate dehydrogenase (NADP+)/methenyltetrahydrofolate cyclohydrolase
MAAAKIIDGKSIAEKLHARVRAEVAAVEAAHGFKPGLAVVLVGDDPASQVYVRSKTKLTGEMGMASFEHRLPAETSEAELLALVDRLNANSAVDGILVQLPLPGHIDTQKIIERLSPAKDVDGLHPVNVARLSAGRPGLVPCTPLGCIILAKTVTHDLTGLEAVVAGRSILVGKPISQLLLAENATVTIAHSRSRDLPSITRRADLLVAAIGRPEMIRGGWITPGAIVIDVGINRIAAPEKGEGKTRIVGDVAFAEASEMASAITPVPGGVGPMTVACLMANTLRAACAARGLPLPDLQTGL